MTPMPEPSTPDKRCATCGYSVPAGWVICGKCGTPMAHSRALIRRSGTDWLLGHRGVLPRRLLRMWQGWDAVALECTLHHPDDKSETAFELALPLWPWRWVCWLQGHRPYDPRLPKDNYCVICRKALA